MVVRLICHQTFQTKKALYFFWVTDLTQISHAEIAFHTPSIIAPLLGVTTNPLQSAVAENL